MRDQGVIGGGKRVNKSMTKLETKKERKKWM